MVYRITDDCMACGNCTVVCSAGAIEDGYTNTIGGIESLIDRPGKQEYADTFFINKKCKQCGECVDICPTGAIVLEKQ